MEATVGNSLYGYRYLKLAKMLCFSYYLLCFLFIKIGEQQIENTPEAMGWGREGGPNNAYTCE
jgi:hypothetical protein